MGKTRKSKKVEPVEPVEGSILNFCPVCKKPLTNQTVHGFRYSVCSADPSHFGIPLLSVMPEGCDEAALLQRWLKVNNWQISFGKKWGDSGVSDKQQV